MNKMIPRYKLVEVNHSDTNFIIEICSGEFTGVIFKIYNIWIDTEYKFNFDYKIIFHPSELSAIVVDDIFTDTISDIILDIIQSLSEQLKNEQTTNDHIERTLSE
jgi:hypothetical protein